MRWLISCYLDQSKYRWCYSVASHNSWLFYFALSFIHLLGLRAGVTCRVHGHGGWDPGQWHHGPHGQDREARVPALCCHQPGLPQPPAQAFDGGLRNSGMNYWQNILILKVLLSDTFYRRYCHHQGLLSRRATTKFIGKKMKMLLSIE